mgnify:CR=1 FL=1
MVRLKDGSLELQTTKILISIPYGAIKRKKFIGIEFLQVISIPYGAIKRLAHASFSNALMTFQFLMVRLKVRH